MPIYSEAPLKRNMVKIWNNQFAPGGINNAQSAALLVSTSFNASLIGVGPTGARRAPPQSLFKNVDLKAYNIQDFENRTVNFGTCAI